MTPPTLTCENCESEIDVAKDPRCVMASVTGHANVMCESCRQLAYDRWRVALGPHPDQPNHKDNE